MIKQIQLFLGPARVRAFILLTGITGLISLMLNAIVNDYEWVRIVQSLLVVVFAVGTAIIFGGRMKPEERARWFAIITPAIGVLVLGQFFFPDSLLLFVGAAFGWLVAGLFVFRNRARSEYKNAIRYLRRQEYDDAVRILDNLIETEPEEEQHYRLRAEILRLAGKLERARQDYTKMVAINAGSAVGYNGLAEVCLQARDYPAAHKAALKAFELSPDEWVAAYNLGMIEDRLGLAEAGIEHLQNALELNVPDVRHRLLVYLYLARAYSRSGDIEAAEKAISAIKRHKSGLEEWQVILDNEMAAVLRDVLAEDVETAQDLVDGKLSAEDLGQQERSKAT